MLMQITHIALYAVALGLLSAALLWVVPKVYFALAPRVRELLNYLSEAVSAPPPSMTRKGPPNTWPRFGGTI